MRANPAGRGRYEWLVTAVAMLSCLLIFALVGRLSPVAGAPAVAVGELHTQAIGPDASGSGRHGMRHAVRIAFPLPPADAAQSRWVVWVPREAVDALQLQRGEWRSAPQSFFHPTEQDGLLPAGFAFPLPADWSGDIALDVSFESSVPFRLKPRLVRESQLPAIEQYGGMMATAVYVSLFMIGLLALALFLAARDRVFLGLLAYAGVALAALLAINGHLYALPLLRGVAYWREFGVVASGALLAAAWLQIVLLYAGRAAAGPLVGRLAAGCSAFLLGIAAASLLNLPVLAPLLWLLLSVGWITSSVLGLVVMADAGRRRVYMGWMLFCMALVSLLAALALSFFGRTQPWDPVVTRYAYQFGITSGAVILFVGLIGRIGDYRTQRDSDRRARQDSERRMRQEAARSTLTGALQARLRALPLKEIEPVALRELLDHVLPLVPAERGAAVMCDHQGRDVVLVEPASQARSLQYQLSAGRLALKRSCAAGAPVQQPVTTESEPGWSGVEAVVPLDLQLPAWGAVLLRRSGGDGFSADELSLVAEFARLTMLHIDDAIAAANLRRSAELDVLTGSYNRRTIDQWLDRAFSAAGREGDPLSVLFIDLDHFKSINDRHGHGGGDACLRALSLALRRALPEGAVLGRYGGDEFIAILVGSGGAAARAVGERMRAAAEELQVEWAGQRVKVTVSVGVATRRTGEKTPAATIDRADKALYAAKRSGRNCVQVAPAVFT